jgi:23S rRNA maturation-related 3'-5' exoribonuclease YhaM
MGNISAAEILKTIQQLTAQLALFAAQLKRVEENEKK